MKKTLLLLAVLSLILVTSSCQKAEEVMISKYFQAMQHNDKDTMSSMCYEPKDIEFKSYEVLTIEEPVSQELQLPILLKNRDDIEKKRKDQQAVAMEKRGELEDTVDTLADARGAAKKELEGKKAILEEEDKTETQKLKSLQMELSKLNKEIEREKALIALSTSNRDTLEMFTGNTEINKITCKIVLANGEEKNYVFMLRKDILKLESRQQAGRQIIVKILTEEEDKQPPVKEEEKTEEVTEPAPAAAEGSTSTQQ